MAHVGGSIGHYGLQDWWLNVLTQQQRDFIQEKLGNNSVATSSLTKGPTDYTSSQSVIGFLTCMAGWFKSHANLHIALIILDQAEKMALPDSNVLDLHFLYGAQAEYYYKTKDPEQNRKAPKAALNQIKICVQVLNTFKQERYYKCPPFHSGFKILFDTFICNERFESAEKICRIALQTGWWEQSHFDKHMTKIEQERIWAKENE